MTDPRETRPTAVIVSEGPLLEALNLISYDGGGQGGWSGFVVPGTWRQWIAPATRALSVMSPEDRDTFCIGEHEAMSLFLGRGTDFVKAGELLTAFFDGDWPAVLADPVQPGDLAR